MAEGHWVFMNRTPKKKVFNLTSGEALHAEPLKEYVLSAEDVKSPELVSFLKDKRNGTAIFKGPPPSPEPAAAPDDSSAPRTT